MKVTFETAALADAVSRANRVAPTKGEPADRAAGVVMDVPGDSTRAAVVRSTDIATTYVQTITVQDVAATEDVTWRFPAAIFDRLLASYPQGGGEMVTLDDERGDGKVHIVHGRTQAQLNPIAVDSYPRWGIFSSEGLIEVPFLAQRLKQVSWCTRRAGEAPQDGIHIDGERLIATDGAGAAEVECKVPIEEPITVPLATLSGLIRNTSSVFIGCSKKRLRMMTDDHTYLTALIYAEEFPDINMVRKKILDYELQCVVNVERLNEVINRMMSLCESERYPRVDMVIGKGFLTAIMDVPQVGRVQDELSIVGGPDKSLEISFSPKYLTKAMEGVDQPHATWRFTDNPLRALHITDDRIFNAYVTPRRVQK